MFKSLASRFKMSSSMQSMTINNNVTTHMPGILSYPLTPSNSDESINKSVSITQSIYEKIELLNKENLLTNFQTENKPFYVTDLGELKRQLNLWSSQLPYVKPYYAVKCNPNPQFIKFLIANYGNNIGFDCASLSEIQTVFHAFNELGMEPNSNNFVYANPIKPISQLKFANLNNINLTTVDSIEEIDKIKNFTNGEMDVLIRITTDDSTATCPLSVKFGADLSFSKKIVDYCVSNNVNVRGVAFHVGSGFKDSSTLIKAIDDSKNLWDYINSKQSTNCNILDIGGGFSKENFIEPSKILNLKLNEYYGDLIRENKMQIISELGRFLSATCFTLVTNVIGTRHELESNKVRVYLNDGLYGNLNCILYDHQEVEPLVVTSNGKYVFESSPTSINNKQYSIWGPTCDGLDCIKSKTSLSHEVVTGDWIAFKNAGAYTNAAATTFNGFTNDFEYIYIDTEEKI